MYFLLAFYFYKRGKFWIYFLILFHKTIPLQNSSYNLSFLNILYLYGMKQKLSSPSFADLFLGQRKVKQTFF